MSHRRRRQPEPRPSVAILRKTRSHFRKKKKKKNRRKYQSPLFFSFSASSRTWRSLFRDFKRGFCTVGKTPAGLPTLKQEKTKQKKTNKKNTSLTFSALFTAEGNVFVIYFFSLSVSIKLSTRVVVCLSFLPLLVVVRSSSSSSPSSSSSFDFFALGLKEPF